MLTMNDFSRLRQSVRSLQSKKPNFTAISFYSIALFLWPYFLPTSEHWHWGKKDTYPGAAVGWQLVFRAVICSHDMVNFPLPHSSVDKSEPQSQTVCLSTLREPGPKKNDIKPREI